MMRANWHGIKRSAHETSSSFSVSETGSRRRVRDAVWHPSPRKRTAWRIPV